MGGQVERPQVHGKKALLRGSRSGHDAPMISTGAILMVLGFVFGIPVLWTIGVIVLVIGLVFAVLGSLGKPIGGRRHYW